MKSASFLIIQAGKTIFGFISENKLGIQIPYPADPMLAQPTAKEMIHLCVGGDVNCCVLELLKTFSMLAASADHPATVLEIAASTGIDLVNGTWRGSPCHVLVCRHQLKGGKQLWSFQQTWLSLPTTAASLPRLDLPSASCSSRRGFQPLSTFLPVYTNMPRAKLHTSTYNGVCITVTYNGPETQTRRGRDGHCDCPFTRCSVQAAVATSCLGMPHIIWGAFLKGRQISYISVQKKAQHVTS